LQSDAKRNERAVFSNNSVRRSMSPLFSTRIVSGSAIAVALLLLASVCGAIRTAATAEPVVVNSAAEARRWLDDRLGRTTLPARFDKPEEGHCFNLAGLLALREDRAELIYPTILGREVGYGPSDLPGAFLLASEHCLIRVHVRQEILDGDQWIAVPLWKRPEIKLPAPDSENAAKQQLPPLGEWRIVPNKPGSGAQLTLERKGFGVWDGASLRTVVFSNSQQSCPHGTALFTVTPAGVTIVFRDTRAQLPFSVDDSVNREDRNVSFMFSAPSCRLTMTIEKEVLSDGEWTRLNPKSE
jgi:hypothetical protein